MRWDNGDYMMSDDPALIDTDTVFRLLSNTYWASQRPKTVMEKSMRNSICFGLFYQGKQVGFARVVTDKAVFSHFCDFVISDDNRGKGLGKWMMECILNHPEIRDTMQELNTKDAYEFYERFGFKKEECMKKLPKK